MASAADPNSMEVRVRRKVAKQLYDALHVEQEVDPLFRSRDQDDDPQAKKKGLKPKPQSPYTFQNFLWIIAAVTIVYFTEFFTVAIYDSRIRRSWFYVGVLLIAVNLAIAFYLIVYLTTIKKISSDDWERQYPAAIPIATASFAFGSFCLTVSLWPVWGVLTLPILFAQFMAVVVIIAMFK